MDEELFDLHNTINGEDDFDELPDEEKEEEEGFEEELDDADDDDSLDPEAE